MSFKAIVFDFDGVLVESLEVKNKAFYELYEPFGEDVARKVLEHHQKNQGISRYEKIAYWHLEFLGIRLDRAGVDALAGKYSALVEEKVACAGEVPGSVLFLERHSGETPLFVASATPRDELVRILEKRGIHRFFSGVFGFPTKKAEALASVIEKSGVAPGQVLMVGDALTDYEAARTRGVSFVGRRTGSECIFPEGVPTVEDLHGLDLLLKNRAQKR